MNILVLGGTRFMGVHLVKKLIEQKHCVTVLTRGNFSDNFADKVCRINSDRENSLELKEALKNKKFDVVFDNIAYTSNDIKAIFEAASFKRYVFVSSMSVYDNLHNCIKEEEYDCLQNELVMGNKNNFNYQQGKRQAETCIFQTYKEISSVAVRFPYVIGSDDYTKRMFFYVENAIKQIPINVDNLDAKMSFINSKEAGEFLAFLGTNNCFGALNAASSESISIREILNYVEKKTGKTAIILKDGLNAPYNETPEYSINCEKASKIGFNFSQLQSWIYDLIDFYISEVN